MQGTLKPKKITPTEVSYWIVVNGQKIGKIIIRALNSRSGEAVNVKTVFYEDSY